MACIEKRPSKEGISYRVAIRRKGTEIYKSFKTEEDAKLYAFFKERLIDNMEAFEVSLNERITLEQILDLKLESIKEYDKRTISDMEMAFRKIVQTLPSKKYYHEFIEDNWLECAKSIYEQDSYRGSKSNTIKISPVTLRRIFANISSAVSHCQSLGINLDNLPLKIIQTFINPLIKSQSK